VTGGAFALVLSAAVIHAVWNILVGGARDPRPATAVAMLAAAAVGLPAAIAAWRVSADAVPWMVPSSALELLYAFLLAAAYRRAAVGVVYPIARGAAPVFVLLFAVVTGAGTNVAQIAGVVMVCAGILLVIRGGVAAARPDVLMALGVAATIAGYTIVDKHGIEHASAVAYFECVLAPAALIYAGWTASRLGVGALVAEVGAKAVGAGAGMFAAYALVLAALDQAPAAAVSAVRESSIVIGALLAAVVLHEPLGRRGVAGAAVVAAGVAVIALV
jgi:drug/metabolite transporter (DMT)-like permease